MKSTSGALELLVGLALAAWFARNPSGFVATWTEIDEAIYGFITALNTPRTVDIYLEARDIYRSRLAVNS